MEHRILILGSFDTKSEELLYLKDRIEEAGCAALTVDTSMGGEAAVRVDHASAQVANEGGASIEEIRNSRDTRWTTEVMTRGASKLALRLFREGRVGGIVAIGGASNTGLSTQVMGALPFGVAKVMVSSMAAVPAYAGSYFGTSDITMIHSVVDIAGLNPLLRSVLARAGAAVCAMAKASGATTLAEAQKSRPRVAITEFKFSEICSRRAAEVLTEAGCEVIAFHANGLGDRAMEELISQGFIDAVLDLVPAGIAEEMLGGNRAAGPHRLEAAAKRGIPQVLTPCGFDMLSCGPLERRDKGDSLWVNKKLGERKLFLPDALRVQARTTGEEMISVADAVADKLSSARGPWTFLVPRKGWSSLSVKGAPLFDPEADEAFWRQLNARIGTEGNLTSLDMELNTPAFGEIAAKTLLDLIEEAEQERCAS